MTLKCLLLPTVNIGGFKLQQSFKVVDQALFLVNAARPTTFAMTLVAKTRYYFVYRKIVT